LNAYKEQTGSVTANSVVSGTSSTGQADIWFGASHVDKENVGENWLADDQVSDMSAGINGPVTRNEGMYNHYASEHAYWSDTTNMDNLRGGDATGKATPGAMEVSSTPFTVTGFGNTRHTYSGDDIHAGKCDITIGTIADWYGDDCPGKVWFGIELSGVARRNVNNGNAWIKMGTDQVAGYVSMTATCGTFNYKTHGDTGIAGVSEGLKDGTLVYEGEGDRTNRKATVTLYDNNGNLQATYKWCWPAV